MNKIKTLAAGAAVAIGALFAAPAMAAVGVSINIGEPGFFGQIDLGDAPPPQVIYSQPRIIEPVAVEEPPIYLRVPAGYERDWIHHCHQYNACGRRVYFVQNTWYNNVYAPHYREVHGHPGPPPGHGGPHHDDHGRGHGHGHDDHGPGHDDWHH